MFLWINVPLKDVFIFQLIRYLQRLLPIALLPFLSWSLVGEIMDLSS